MGAEKPSRRHIIGDWWCDAGDPACFHNPPECGHPGCQGTKRSGIERRVFAGRLYDRKDDTQAAYAPVRAATSDRRQA